MAALSVLVLAVGAGVSRAADGMEGIYDEMGAPDVDRVHLIGPIAAGTIGVPVWLRDVLENANETLCEYEVFTNYRPEVGVSSTIFRSRKGFFDLNESYRMFGISLGDEPSVPVPQHDAPSHVVSFSLLASSARTVFAEFSHAETIAVWLNGKRIVMGSGREVADGILTPMAMCKGRNVIVAHVKTTKGPIEAAFGVRFYLHAGEALSDRARQARPLIATPVVDRAAMLRLTVGPGVRLHGRLTGIISGVSLPCDVLPDGRVLLDQSSGEEPEDVYELWVENCPRKVQEFVCIGNPERIFDRLRALLRQKSDLPTTPTINAVLHRVRHLLKPTNRNAADVWWGRKFSFAAGEAAVLLSGRSSISGATGLHLRGFFRINGSESYYRIAFPDGHDRSALLPLIVIPPGVMAANRPYLESAVIANHEEAILLQQLATELNTAFLWPSTVGPQRGRPMEVENIHLQIEDALANFPIDRKCVYIIGHCSAGLTALQYLLRYTEDIAAIALSNAFTRYGFQSNDGLGPGTYDYLKCTEPLERFEAIEHKPIHVFNSSGDPEHGPIGDSIAVIEKLIASGRRPTFWTKVYSKSDYYQKRDWLEDYRRICVSLLAVRNEEMPHALKVRVQQSQVYYWIEVLESTNPKVLSKIDIYFKDGVIGLERIDNVRALRIMAGKLGMRPGETCVIRNGTQIIQRTVDTQGRVDIDLITSGLPREPLLPATPIQQVFGHTLSIAYVARGGRANQNRMAALEFQKEVERYTGNSVPVFRDDDARACKAGVALVLCGQPENSVLFDEARGSLMCSIGSDCITYLSMRFAGANLGAILNCRNPKNGMPMIVIAGQPEGFRRPIEAASMIMDGAYDYIVWDCSTGGILSRGFAER